MSRRIIYLHIGPHGTGTTTIQKHLISNRGMLAKHSCVYPKSTISTFGHHQLVGDIGDFYWYQPSRGNLKTLKDEIGASPGDVILSSETFADIGSAKPLERLRDAFIQDFDFRIITYLRAQEERLQFLWNADIQMGFSNFPFLIWIDENIDQIPSLNIETWLGLYADVFGSDALCPQIYRRRRESLFQHFLKLCGITDYDGFIPLPDQNKSISNLHAEIFRQLAMIPALDPVKDKERIHIIRTDKKEQSAFLRDLHGPSNPMPMTEHAIDNFLNSRNIDLNGTLYTPALLQSVRDRFRESNAQVSKTYFDGKPLFEAKTPKLISPNVFAQFSKADIAALTNKILTAYRKANADAAYADAVKS